MQDTLYESLDKACYRDDRKGKARCVKCSAILIPLEATFFQSLLLAGKLKKKDVICFNCRDGKTPRNAFPEKKGYRRNILGNWIKVDENSKY